MREAFFNGGGRPSSFFAAMRLYTKTPDERLRRFGALPDFSPRLPDDGQNRSIAEHSLAPWDLELPMIRPCDRNSSVLEIPAHAFQRLQLGHRFGQLGLRLGNFHRVGAV